MISANTDPHAQFCCVTHGCRFNNNKECAVFKGIIPQLNKCGESSICTEYRASYIVDHDDSMYS